MEQTPKYEAGQRLRVWSDIGVYRNVVLMNGISYYHRGQCFMYEYLFDPLPQTDPATGITPSMGGTAAEHYFKARL